MDAADSQGGVEKLDRQLRDLLPALLRVARMLTRDEYAAEDLVQETVLRALRHIGSFQPGTNLKAWLMTILRHTHIDLHRGVTRRVAAGSLEGMEHEPVASAERDEVAWSSPEQLLDRFSDEQIESALRALPEAMRWTLLLLDVEQMSVCEAAEVLETAAGTVKSRASRARAQLRAALLPEARRRGWVQDGGEHER